MKVLRLALSAVLVTTVSYAYTTTTTTTFSSTLRKTSTLSMIKLPPYGDDPLINSRLPHQLKNGRGQFLGFRNVKDLQKQKQSSSSSAAPATSDTALQSSIGAGALMPDGGLSPCVIRVLGVGGGGCNAVRRTNTQMCVCVCDIMLYIVCLYINI